MRPGPLQWNYPNLPKFKLSKFSDLAKLSWLAERFFGDPSGPYR